MTNWTKRLAAIAAGSLLVTLAASGTSRADVSGTASPSVPSVVAAMSRMTLDQQRAYYASLSPADAATAQAAAKPAALRTGIQDANGAVLWQSDAVAIDPLPVNAEAVPVRNELVPQVPAGVALNGNSTRLTFFECIYGPFENKLACFYVPSEWAWNATNVTAYSEYQTHSTHYFFWEFDKETVSKKLPSVTDTSAVHFVEGGDFCYRVGFSFFSGCLQHWIPTFDITLYIKGGYYATDIGQIKT